MKHDDDNTLAVFGYDANPVRTVYGYGAPPRLQALEMHCDDVVREDGTTKFAHAKAAMYLDVAYLRAPEGLRLYRPPGDPCRAVVTSREFAALSLVIDDEVWLNGETAFVTGVSYQQDGRVRVELHIPSRKTGGYAAP